VDKPVLNVFRMFGMMKGNRVGLISGRAYDLRTAVDSSFRKNYTDINGMACKDANEATILLWNYHDEDLKGEPENVSVKIKGLPQKSVLLHHYRIDDEHSNSYEVWKKMGSPQNPSQEQIKILEKAGQLELYGPPVYLNPSNGEAAVDLVLPRQGVSLLRLEW
jgi:xylan 1,4-beta-xylosidase